MITAVLTLLLGILVILAIIAANGYFVAQEFAYMSVDRSRLGAAAEAGDADAKRALGVTRRTSFMLSGAQLGITVTGLLIGYVAEPLVGESLAVLLGGAGVPKALSISVGTVLALVIATVVQMIFGELYPKNLAIANAEPLSKKLARSTTIYLAVFGWLIAFFDWSANTLLKLVRIEPVHDVDATATPEDLERIVADSRDSGDLPVELSMLIDRILDFPDRDVEHAMIPRSQVGAVRPATTVGDLRARMADAHSRYPVVSEEGEPLGVVQLVDLLGSDLADEAPVTDLMREPIVVPTLMSLPDALDELTGTGVQLACVIDDHGGFAGVLTVEDLAEELVGELTDEHDEEPPPSATAEDERVWRLGGELPVDELERAIGLRLPEGDFETVAGLVIAEEGELLEAGQVVRVELPASARDMVRDGEVQRVLDVEVLEVSRHVPSEVRVSLHELTPADGEDATDGGATVDDSAADDEEVQR